MGDFITIGSFPNAHDNNWIGIALCVAFVAHYDPPGSSYAKAGPWVWCMFCNQNRKVNVVHVVANIGETDGVMVELVHLCLLYFTRKELINGAEDLDDLDGSRFELKVVCSLPEDRLHLEVKNWGMRVIFKQDLEELNHDG